jgi:transcriptional regulator with XRE-family HTH domain
MAAKGELENPRITTRSITRLYGEQIRKRREGAALTQKEAAEALGVSQATMSRFEAGDAQPDYATFRTMSEVFGCKMSEIVPRNQYPSAPLDPAARRLHFIRRNAMIQGQDPDEAVAMFLERTLPEPNQRGDGK